MGADTRVCPYCGQAPGPGVFCAACGRNLSAVERLPTRAEWEAESGYQAEPGHDDAVRETEDPASRAAAIAGFLAAMHGAGDPGLSTLPTTPRRAFGRQPKIEGWVVRPVDRDDEVRPRRYEPGLFLSAEGSFHRLDSELRGFGQRDFPVYYESVAREPIEPPAEEQLVNQLAALLRAHGLASGGAAPRPDE